VGVTRESRRTVFRRIACQPTIEWPVYTSSPLYDRASLAGLESDIRGVAGAWFNHVHHESVEVRVCSPRQRIFQFNVHDCYEGPTRYEIDTLFRLFVLKELHGWEHETALYEYLESHPELCERLGLETVPEQSTLWAQLAHTLHEYSSEDGQESSSNDSHQSAERRRHCPARIGADPPGSWR